MKKVLIFGGTGAMGTYLIKILCQKQFDITVTSRSAHKSTYENVRYIQGNAKDNLFLQKLSKIKWDAIVDFMVYDTEEFKNRIDLLLAITEQYIFISSARVYAASDRPITEDSPRLLDVCDDERYLCTDEYALSKAREEDVLLQHTMNNYTIVRPSLTYSSNRLQFAISEKEEWLYRALHNQSIIFPSDMMNIRNTMTYGYDVSLAISRLIGNERAYGEIIHITTRDNMTWQEVLEVYQGVLKKKTGHMAKIYMAENSLKIAGDLGRYYQIKYARSINRIFDNSKLESIIGETNFTSMKTGLEMCLSDFLENEQRFHKINVFPQAYFDRMVGEKTILSEFVNAQQKMIYCGYYYTPKTMNRLKRLRTRFRSKVQI